MMRIVPAVDIRDGRCVNLIQGDYARETVFSDDPVEQAVRWRDQGAALVHVVDLDGARSGVLRAWDAIRAIAGAGVPFELGGGIRDLKTIEAVAAAGAQRVILGTAAHRDPEFLQSATAAFPGKIVVGVDASGGKVALSGWSTLTATGAVEFARAAEAAGAERVIYTDILSDGMMMGPNVEATREVAQAVGIPVTASGGISSLDDLRRLQSLEADGVDEIIVGRALYLGAFTLAEALAVAREMESDARESS